MAVSTLSSILQAREIVGVGRNSQRRSVAALAYPVVGVAGLATIHAGSANAEQAVEAETSGAKVSVTPAVAATFPAWEA
jgi:hypothetical protein